MVNGEAGAGADVDVVDDGPIPSQMIHLDFEPIYPGSHNEGISHTFPAAPYWEQSEPQISNLADSRTSIETITNTDAMVDYTTNSPIYFQNEVVDQLDTASLVFPSTWHRETSLHNIYSIFSVARDDKNTMVIKKCIDVDLEKHEATFSICGVELKTVKNIISLHHLQELLDEFNRAKLCQGLKGLNFQSVLQASKHGYKNAETWRSNL
jgi:hypothetical protein